MTLYSKITIADVAAFFEVTVQAIHKTLKTKKLESYKSKNIVYFGYETSRKLFNINFKKMVVAFQIVKGGTGKTSLAHAFAIRANLYGCKVLCIDLDQQGNLTQAFRVNPDNTPVMIDILKNNYSIKDSIVNLYPGLDLLPSRIENAILDNFIMLEKHSLERIYSELLSKLRPIYDLIIIDCPPALGQSVAAATLTADKIISPLTPEQFSLRGMEITYEEIMSLNRKFDKKISMHAVLNKFDMRTALSSEILSSLMKEDVFKNILYKTVIRNSQEFPNALFIGSNIFSNLKSSPAKEDIDLLTQEILELKKPH